MTNIGQGAGATTNIGDGAQLFATNQSIAAATSGLTAINQRVDLLAQRTDKARF